MKVLMVGPARSVNGGISAVVNNYYKVGLDEKIELSYIGTMEDGTKLHKLKVALCAYVSFIKEVRAYDIVHVHMASDSSLYRKIPFMYMAKWFGKKLIIHQHGGNFAEFYYSQCSAKRQKFIEKALNKADAFLVVASYLADIFENIVPKEKIAVLPNAIEVPLSYEKKNPGQKVLFLGRLCKEKGIRELLEVATELKEEYKDLEVYLGGVWEDRDLKEIADKNSTFVYQLGWIENQEKEKYLNLCNIFALPTYFEGLPMSLLEAMAHGCTCIASAVGGIPQVMEDGKDGILIQPKDKEALKTALRMLLSDTGIQENLRQEAFQKVRQEYDLQKSVEKLVYIYKQIVFSH